MRWQLRRGLLEPAGAPRPGSQWWRALNEAVLRDIAESRHLVAGAPGDASSPAVEAVLDFIRGPSAARWYRAHNVSIVRAYLANGDLAAREGRVERFFINVVLLPVLYAHALVAAPRLALGWLSPVAPVLGDPRVGTTGIFLSLSRVLPNSYPLGDDVTPFVAGENGFGRLLEGSGIIQPRLRALYDWSARELGPARGRGAARRGHPRLRLGPGAGLRLDAAAPRARPARPAGGPRTGRHQARPWRRDCDEPMTAGRCLPERGVVGRRAAATVDFSPAGGRESEGIEWPSRAPPGTPAPTGGLIESQRELRPFRRRPTRTDRPLRPTSSTRRRTSPRPGSRASTARTTSRAGSRTTPRGWPSSNPRASSSGATSVGRGDGHRLLDGRVPPGHRLAGRRFGMEISVYARSIALEAGVRVDRDIFSESDFFDLVIFRGTIQHLDEPFKFHQVRLQRAAARRLSGLPGDAQHQLALLPPQEDAPVPGCAAQLLLARRRRPGPGPDQLRLPRARDPLPVPGHALCAPPEPTTGASCATCSRGAAA